MRERDLVVAQLGRLGSEKWSYISCGACGGLQQGCSRAGVPVFILNTPYSFVSKVVLNEV
jgi:hypothetical protein